MIVQGIGMLGSLLGIYIFDEAFTVGNPTLEFIIIGFLMTITTFSFTVYDCIKVIRLETKHFI